jgi:predicted nuclease of predicted toxin-antitoxin system
MKFLLDENVEFRFVQALTDDGHDVTTIARDYPASITDREVLDIAVRESRVLVTNDRDFGELVVRQQLLHAGLIYFRYPLATATNEKISRLREIIAEHSDLLKQFVVITPAGFRVHHAEPHNEQ